MKNSIVLILVFAGICSSCKKEKMTDPKVVEAVAVQDIVSNECYIGILKKDTVSLTFNTNDSIAKSGKLSYHFFEKDKNDGEFSGEMKGDTLFADYTFMSEGVSSIREVAFLKKGDTFTEGYGEIMDNIGKVTFKDKKTLKFDGKIVLKKADCKE